MGRWNPFRLNGRIRALMLAVVLGVVILAVYAAGILIPQDAVGTDFIQAKQPPSWQHRCARNAATCISAVAGILIGIAAAAGSRFLDGAVSWLIDLMMGIPHTVLIMLISFAMGRGLRGLLAGIAATHWTSLARLIRGEVMQLRSRQYIMVSRRMGKSGGWILRHHLLPHLAPQFLTGLILMFPHAILHEASISFLGYGLPPEQPAVGIMLAESMTYLSSGMWWMAVFPGMVLVLMVWLIDRLGENLRRVIDPYSAQE